MNYKVITYVFFVIALIVGILSLINQSTFAIAAVTSRFFEIMVPILGVAALLKYLMCCGTSDKNCNMVFYVFVVIAIVVGILSLINQNTFAIAAITSRFFEIMIPVLAIAALYKYLCCNKTSCN